MLLSLLEKLGDWKWVGDQIASEECQASEPNRTEERLNRCDNHVLSFAAYAAFKDEEFKRSKVASVDKMSSSIFRICSS
jgi:hypothetical protein